MKPNQTGHVLLRHVTDEVAAVALGLFVLVLWGGMFPLAVWATLS